MAEIMLQGVEAFRTPAEDDRTVSQRLCEAIDDECVHAY